MTTVVNTVICTVSVVGVLLRMACGSRMTGLVNGLGVCLSRGIIAMHFVGAILLGLRLVMYMVRGWYRRRNSRRYRFALFRVCIVIGHVFLLLFLFLATGVSSTLSQFSTYN